MHRAAVWQHSSNSNIKIVHNSINNFLWNPSDFSSDDVLCCLRIVFKNSVFQVLPQKIVRRVETLRIGWLGAIGFTRNEPVSGEVMPEVFKCSTLFEKWGGASFLKQNRTLEYLRHNVPWDRLISRQTDNPWPSYSQDLKPPDYFLREYLKDRVCENNPQTTEDIIRRAIRWIPQEMVKRVVHNFNVRVAAVLSYSSVVTGTNIVLITKKV